MRNTWNQVSAIYQARQQIAVDSAYYGPWAPPESELQLLGDVRGLQILDLGCGGGQSTIAFTQQGATAVGIDISDQQLAYARRLATQAGVEVTFRQGNAEALTSFATASLDMIFSTYTLPYVDDVPRCLSECQRVLRPGGRLIFSLDHPLRDCFFDTEDDELTLYPVRDYFDNTPLVWRFPTTDAILRSHHFTVAQWLTMLHTAGFQLRQLLEPAPRRELLDQLWPLDGPLGPLRNLPQTIIFVGET